MNKIILEAKAIAKSYSVDGKTENVLRGVDLKIAHGEFASIVGPSGAGKTTLLHLLAGLDTASSGNVLFDGKDIAKMSQNHLCRMRNEKVGFVFQFYHLLPEFNVLENVLMPAISARKKLSKDVRNNLLERALWLLEKMELDEKIKYFPNQLSGGQKQRVAIARGLINRPEIIFCDEPTGNLDSKTGDEIMDLLKKISQENRMSLVLVTHNQELAGSADKIYHLKDGSLQEAG